MLKVAKTRVKAKCFLSIRYKNSVIKIFIKDILTEYRVMTPFYKGN